jgi:hypothetical protein
LTSWTTRARILASDWRPTTASRAIAWELSAAMKVATKAAMNLWLMDAIVEGLR